MDAIAIIPARGGSKGIENKNLQTVGNVSLIGRAINSAMSVEEIQEVYVSTDSDEIAREATFHGAKPIMRPAEISGDESSSESAILHAIEHVEEVSTIVFIQCTSPFIRSSDVSKAIQMVETGIHDCVFSAVEDHGFRWEMKGKELSPMNHSVNERPRRQDLPQRFLETGAFYVFRAKGIHSTGSRFHGDIGCVEVDRLTNVDIDDIDDLIRARQLSPILDEKPKTPAIRGLVLDFDGVQTDDYVWVDQDGRESVRVSRADGLAISMIKKSGVEILILSSETNPVVKSRADKLGVQSISGAKDKSKIMKDWANRLGLDLSSIAFLGNDKNDLQAMKQVGLPVAVADATPSVKAIAAIVLGSKGGEKAVRELAGILFP